MTCQRPLCSPSWQDQAIMPPCKPPHNIDQRWRCTCLWVIEDGSILRQKSPTVALHLYSWSSGCLVVVFDGGGSELTATKANLQEKKDEHTVTLVPQTAVEVLAGLGTSQSRAKQTTLWMSAQTPEPAVEVLAGYAISELVPNTFNRTLVRRFVKSNPFQADHLCLNIIDIDFETHRTRLGRTKWSSTRWALTMVVLGPKSV
ncbi:uncharacterized protein BT62DRAFT_367244 [Guyanagaster necrorhizus]|uniref:Uncharacterized protein n=1 Tax=Guyanagaster necrorhizus TaxID=856835 RepID=A0A9P7VKA6_9AGAR|nr:uncharacterized protein BT62DRAFT_367244 [Guyanagaster necrorhizus MCA 3950]KAG7442678.1 hypothetical protein BT62DRAFT_367244 [Guyanagaster necrorhizus MCA 3950]